MSPASQSLTPPQPPTASRPCTRAFPMHASSYRHAQFRPTPPPPLKNLLLLSIVYKHGTPPPPPLPNQGVCLVNKWINTSCSCMQCPPALVFPTPRLVPAPPPASLLARACGVRARTLASSSSASCCAGGGGGGFCSALPSCAGSAGGGGGGVGGGRAEEERRRWCSVLVVVVVCWWLCTPRCHVCWLG